MLLFSHFWSPSLAAAVPLRFVVLAMKLKAVLCFSTARPHREDPELPQPQVCKEVCHWLLLWSCAEVEIWNLRHWQRDHWSQRWRLPWRTGVYAGPGKGSSHFSSSLVLQQFEFAKEKKWNQHQHVANEDETHLITASVLSMGVIWSHTFALPLSALALVTQRSRNKYFTLF